MLNIQWLVQFAIRANRDRKSPSPAIFPTSANGDRKPLSPAILTVREIVANPTIAMQAFTRIARCQ